jgi:hypothetical protein
MEQKRFVCINFLTFSNSLSSRKTMVQKKSPMVQHNPECNIYYILKAQYRGLK